MNAYVDSLSDLEKSAYSNKLKLIGDVDPFNLEAKDLNDNVDSLPFIDHGDIVHYLVFQTNSLTKEQMKAYKSLESHNYFTSGWVDSKIFCKTFKEVTILLGKVKHSQCLRKPPLKVWIAAHTKGDIITAHCTCMAGMGESCSHVGALLFAISHHVKIRESTSSTDMQNKWLPPNQNSSLYAPVSQLDFRSAKRKYKEMAPKSVKKASKNEVPEPSEEDMVSFLGKVESTEIDSAILLVVSPFNDRFVKEKPHSMYVLSNLFDEKFTSFSYEEIIPHCREIFTGDVFRMGFEVAKGIEELTRKQAKCSAWFSFRAGRITASNMKAVCRTNPSNPAISTIMKVCYPQTMKFSSAATSWGCRHEDLAKKRYFQVSPLDHQSFQTRNCGLVINPEFSFIGASPDAFISCECCGEGVLEVKCPYCARYLSIESLANDKKSCLETDEAGNITLVKNHQYYFQIQTQLFVSNRDYCDFVVWTEEDIHVERIYPQITFWEEVLENASYFYLQAVLPELMGKWFSRKNSSRRV